MEALQPKIEMPIYPHPDIAELKTPCRRPVTQNQIPQRPVPQRNELVGWPQQPIEWPQQPVVFAPSHFDTRELVEQTAEWPNSVHGLVAVDFDNTRCWGTGILIGPNIVLTAAHNLYDFDKRIYAKLETMQFLPGINGQQLPFDFVEVEQHFISPNYITERTEDYAILILKEPIGYKTGYFGLCPEPEDPESQDINIYGYPFDKVEDRRNTYEMWRASGEVGRIDPVRGIISHVISTNLGQSGSGVWYKKGRDYYIYGVHISTSATGLGKRATLLTKACYKRIYAWLECSRFCGFLFELGKKPNLRDFDINFNEGEFE